MSVEKRSKPSQVPRILLIIVGVLIFVGLITYSVLEVRHPVDGTAKTEFFVTERSLTHSVERAPDGELATPAGTGDEKPGQGKACPT